MATSSNSSSFSSSSSSPSFSLAENCRSSRTSDFRLEPRGDVNVIRGEFPRGLGVLSGTALVGLSDNSNNSKDHLLFSFGRPTTLSFASGWCFWRPKGWPHVSRLAALLPRLHFELRIPLFLTRTLRFRHVHRVECVLIVVAFLSNIEEVAVGLLLSFLLGNANVALQVGQVFVILKSKATVNEKS